MRVSLLPATGPKEAFAQASRFPEDLFCCLTARGDELFDLVDALLCADGPVTSPVDLTLVAEHRRGHGAMYEALNCGSVDVPRLRQVLAGLPMPRAPTAAWSWRPTSATGSAPTRRPARTACSATSTAAADAPRTSSSPAGRTPSSPPSNRAAHPGARSWTPCVSDRRTTSPRSLPPSSTGWSRT
ncbi:transposase [Streptomyces sp. NPDC001617]